MNIVQMILELLSGNVLSKLSGLIGENEVKTKTALGAAVPALLSGLSNLASNEHGAQKLAGALGKIDAGSLDNIGNMLSGGSADSLAEQGGSLLSSLLGGNAVTGLANTIARFAGLSGGASKNLLSYLGPLVLGGIAKQFAGKTLNAQSLMNLFSSQKANIASAIPSGLSLANVPGLDTARSAATAAYGSTKQAVAPAKSILPWVIGAAALAALLFFLWQRVPRESPEVAKLTKDVTGTFTSLADTLGGIKDVASAKAAVPALTELGTKLSAMQAVMDKLPPAAKSTITALIKPGLDKLKDRLNSVLMIPGVGAVVQPALEGIVGKLTKLGGLTTTDFSLPAPQVTELGGSISATIASLTKSLSGVTDAASAEAALPKLKDLNGQLDTTMSEWGNLPDAGKATIGSVMKSALTSLSQLVTKVLAIGGVGDHFKPVVEEILRKLMTIGG